MKVSFSRGDSYFIYYLEDNISYTKLDTDNYIAKQRDNILNFLYNIKDNFDRVVSTDSYIKRLYWDGNRPVVEVNLVLNKKTINDILDSDIITDDIEITVTFKNDAIMNEIINSKVIIANKSNNKRVTVVYRDNTFKVTDNDGKITDYVFQKKGNDFTIKIMKDNQLYSIVNAIKKDSNYQYSYQVIDKTYNLMLDVISNGNNIKYQFSSHIGDNNDNMVEKKLVIEGNRMEDGALSKDTFKSVDYSTLSKDDKDKFDTSINNFFLPIREFIDEYKNSIN